MQSFRKRITIRLMGMKQLWL